MLNIKLWVSAVCALHGVCMCNFIYLALSLAHWTISASRCKYFRLDCIHCKSSTMPFHSMCLSLFVRYIIARRLFISSDAEGDERESMSQRTSDWISKTSKQVSEWVREWTMNVRDDASGSKKWMCPSILKAVNMNFYTTSSTSHIQCEVDKS